MGVEEDELEEEGRGIKVGEKVGDEVDEGADEGETTGGAGEDIKGLMVAGAPCGEPREGLLGVVSLSWAVGLGVLAVPLVPGMRTEALLAVGTNAKLAPFTDWLESEAVGAVAPVLMSGTVTVGGDSSAPAEGASSVGDSSGAAPGLGPTRSLDGTLTVLRFDGGAVPLTRPCTTEQADHKNAIQISQSSLEGAFVSCRVDKCCRQMLWTKAADKCCRQLL